MPRHGQAHHGRHGNSRHNYSNIDQTSRWQNGNLPLRSGTKECKMYRQNGFCSFGPTCKYMHEKIAVGRPTTPVTPLSHPVPLKSMNSGGPQVHQVGSPNRKTGGHVYSATGVNVGKGLGSLLLEQQRNVENNSLPFTSTRGYNNNGKTGSNHNWQNGNSHRHRHVLSESAIYESTQMQIKYQKSGLVHETASPEIPSGLIGYSTLPLLEFGSNIPGQFLSGTIESVHTYQTGMKNSRDVIKGDGGLPTGGYTEQECTSQAPFYGNVMGYSWDGGVVPGSGQIDLQCIQPFDTRGPQALAGVKSPNAQPPVYKESDHHHKGYFCSSWPYVPNPWHPPGVPNKHMQLQLQAMQSPRAEGPVTRTAFLLKPERKEHQDGTGYIAPKKNNQGKRMQPVSIIRAPHAAQLMPLSSAQEFVQTENKNRVK